MNSKFLLLASAAACALSVATRGHTVDEAAQRVTLPSAADYSSSGQYTFVNVNASGQAAQVSGSGGAAVGVLYNKPSGAGRAAEVAISGIVKIVAGGVLGTIGVKISSTAAGKAQLASTGHHVLGTLLETAGADGDIVSILLNSKHILA